MKAIYLLVIGVSLLAGNLQADDYSDLSPQDREAARKLQKMIDDDRAKRDAADAQYQKEHEPPSDGLGIGGWFCFLGIPAIFVFIFINAYKKAKHGDQIKLNEHEIRAMAGLALGAMKTADQSSPSNKRKPPVRQPKSPRVEPVVRPTPPRFLGQENGAILFECGYCSQRIEIDAAGGGMEIKCPECGEPQKVPTF